MSDVAVKQLSDFAPSPLAQGIASGSVAIQKRNRVAVPEWVNEILAELHIPYIVTVMVLLVLIAFSFGEFMQDQLYTESTFLVSYLDINPQAADEAWL